MALGAAGCASAPGNDPLPTSGASEREDAGTAGGSGGADEGSGDAGGTAGPSMDDAALRFVECMRENGVEMEDPEPGGGVKLHVNPDSAALVEAAQEICQPIMDEARADAPGTPGRDEEQYDKLLAAAQCMRDKGYDYPDPEMDASGRVSQKFRVDQNAGLDQETMHRDQEDCQADVGLTGGPGISGGDESSLDSIDD
jgi:hypothetical protein